MDDVILSCARTTGVGFLRDERRVNVALTRARRALYIVGRAQTLKKNDTWCALLENAHMRGRIFTVDSP